VDDRLIIDEFELIRDELRLYLDPSTPIIKRFTAAYNAGAKVVDLMKRYNYSSVARIATALKVPGITADILRKILDFCEKISLDVYLDRVHSEQPKSIEEMWASERYRVKTDETYKDSPAEVNIRIINELAKGLEKMKTYDFSLKELKKISAYLTGKFPAITRQSMIRDPWFFAMQPCVGCGEEVDIVKYPDGYDVLDYQLGIVAFLVPMCETCKKTGKVDHTLALTLYARYAKRLEEEILDALTDFDSMEVDDIIIGD